MACIYQIKNLVNNKIYIGSTIRKTYIRKYEHFSALRNGKHCNSYLQRAFNKYGEENFDFIILETFVFPDNYNSVIKAEYLTSREFYLIKLLSANYNIKKEITIGNTGYKHSEETRKKIGEANKTKTPSKRTLIKRERESRRIDGILIPSNILKKHSEKTKQKLKQIGLQQHVLDRMSIMSKLGNAAWKEQKHSLESKLKILKARVQQNRIIKIYDKNTNELLHSCIFSKEASSYTGISRSAISNNLINLSKSAGKFIFKYKNII